MIFRAHVQSIVTKQVSVPMSVSLSLGDLSSSELRAYRGLLEALGAHPS